LIISIQGILVVATNVFVSVISTAMMLLVLWQAPRQRSNQIFAAMMFALLFFSFSNITQRLVDVLQIDPELMLNINTTLYAWFIVLMIIFVEEFTRLKSQLKLVGIVMAAIATVLLVTGSVFQNSRPSPTDPGGYLMDMSTVGVLLVVSYAIYVTVILVVLRRSTDPRAKMIWPAVLSVLVGVILVSLRPLSAIQIGGTRPFGLILTIPYNSIGLALAALIIGYTVLKYQLFDPLYKLNKDLEKANHDLAQANRELAQANEMKTQFLANMSHELRTPLNAIIGYTQMAVDGIYGPLTQKQEDRLARVVVNGYNLLALINDLLDISKIEAGRLTLVPKRIDTVDLIQKVSSTLEPLAEKKGLTLAIQCDDTPPIFADEERARQVLTNIGANAIKFTPGGGVTIRTQREGKFLRFSVIDTGIGIPADALSTIFEQFRQVDASFTRQYEGSGLGLTIARRLVEMQHGHITVESTVGVGSTFHVMLPLAEIEAPKTLPAVQTGRI
jgi:signal transduction histidine kinase